MKKHRNKQKGKGVLGFEGHAIPTGHGSVTLKAEADSMDIGDAWSIQPTHAEDTEHAEDAVVDYCEALNWSRKIYEETKGSGNDDSILSKLADFYRTRVRDRANERTNRFDGTRTKVDNNGPYGESLQQSVRHVQEKEHGWLRRTADRTSEVWLGDHC